MKLVFTRFLLVAFAATGATVGPSSAQPVLAMARDAGRLVGMGKACGGEIAMLADQHTRTFGNILNDAVDSLYRSDAKQSFDDARELAEVTQATGRGLACAEVQVLLRQNDRSLVRILTPR